MRGGEWCGEWGAGCGAEDVRGVGVGVELLISRLTPWLPYTPSLMVLGMLMGFASAYEPINVMHIHESISLWERFDGHLLVFVFIPPLVFGEAMAMDWQNRYHLRDCNKPARDEAMAKWVYTFGDGAAEGHDGRRRSLPHACERAFGSRVGKRVQAT